MVSEFSNGESLLDNLRVGKTFFLLILDSTAYYEKELLTRQNRAYRAEFDLMRQSERQTSVLRHDMKNHLAVLREYAAQGKLQELERYLDAFGQKLIRPGLIQQVIQILIVF